MNPSSSAASSGPEVAGEAVAQGTAVCAKCGIPIQPEPSSAENSHLLGQRPYLPRGTRRIFVPDQDGSSAFQLIEVCTICSLIHDIGVLHRYYWAQVQPEVEQDSLLLIALTEVCTLLRRRVQVDLNAIIARALRENPQP